jgi:hypothetical protein
VRREAIGSPAILIVGDVARAAQCLELGVDRSLAA